MYFCFTFHCGQYYFSKFKSSACRLVKDESRRRIWMSEGWLSNKMTANLLSWVLVQWSRIESLDPCFFLLLLQTVCLRLSNYTTDLCSGKYNDLGNVWTLVIRSSFINSRMNTFNVLFFFTFRFVLSQKLWVRSANTWRMLGIYSITRRYLEKIC